MHYFSNFGNNCERCGHSKTKHSFHTSYKYYDEKTKYKKNNFLKILEEKDRFYNKKHEYYSEYSRKKNEKNILENELNNFKNEKNQLENQKSYYINNKESIKENIKQKDKNIMLIILDLLKIYNRIKNIALNPNHKDIENEYIEESIQRLEDIGSDKIQIKKLKEFQKYNKIFNEI